MEWKFSKNEKVNKVILVVLVGVMLLVIVMPMKPANQGLPSTTADESGKQEALAQCVSHEERLKSMLEKTYGEGNISVMIYESEAMSKADYYGTGSAGNSITGVLIVISSKVVTETTLSDINLAVCALFDLPAHKVAVLVKK